MNKLYRANYNIKHLPVFYCLSAVGTLEYYNPYRRKWVVSNLDPALARSEFTLVGTNVKFKV